MSYILSNDNRFYVALEQSYGNAVAITASNRIPALKLSLKQRTEPILICSRVFQREIQGQIRDQLNLDNELLLLYDV